jgi:hypothetical protein
MMLNNIESMTVKRVPYANVLAKLKQGITNSAILSLSPQGELADP